MSASAMEAAQVLSEVETGLRSGGLAGEAALGRIEAVGAALPPEVRFRLDEIAALAGREAELDREIAMLRARRDELVERRDAVRVAATGTTRRAMPARRVRAILAVLASLGPAPRHA